MTTESILIVDDDAPMSEMLGEFLVQEGYRVIQACSAMEAMVGIRREAPDLVLMDVRLPDANGIDFLKSQILPEMGEFRVIVITGYNDQDDAHSALRLGAYDYLTKPVALSKLSTTIRNCLHLHRLARELAQLSGKAPLPRSLRELVGISPQMRALVEQIKRVAPFDVPVLILGENGTGKELVAWAIHTLSPRGKNPFVPIDFGALPETLVEAEAFGYERGAFSGADHPKAGKLEQASGGTVFLDEIGNIPLQIQPKLLRVLQSQTVERLGGPAVRVDCRLISATNAVMAHMLEEGTFRRDLYHRLNTVVLTVPPLRDRVGDIALLAHYALMMAIRMYKKPVLGICPETMALLEAYPWPGNVRELENTIRSAMIQASDLIRPEHLPEQVSAWPDRQEDRPVGNAGSSESLSRIRRQAADEAERAAILRMLEETGWNKAETARRFGVNYKTLYVKICHHKIQPARTRPNKKFDRA